MADIVLSHTQISMWRSCPRSYFFKYIAQRVPIVVDQKLSFGRLWDEATGVWWQDGIDAVRDWLIENAASMDEIDAIKIATLIKYYQPPDSFDLISTQEKIDVPIRHPDTNEPMPGVMLRCKADSILDYNGGRFVREAKITAKDIDGYGPFWQVLQANSQVGIYWLAFGADGLVYDVAHKPGIKPSAADIDAAASIMVPGYEEMNKAAQAHARKGICQRDQLNAYQVRMDKDVAENTDKYFQFRLVHKTEKDVRQAKEDLWAWASMMIVARDKQWHPRNDHSCSSFFGTCPYLAVCSGTTTIEDESLYTAPDWAVDEKDEERMPF
jgi:hypothetical protein